MAVVRPTSAVSVTRKTLKGSMKNCSRAKLRLPAPITCTVRAQAARNVTRLKATLSSGAKRRAPKIASTAAPASGLPMSSRNSMLLAPLGDGVLAQGFEMMEIQAVELLADLEKEDAEHQHRDQHVECHAELHYHRHAVGGTHRAEEKTVLHRQEPHHLRHGLAA